MSRREIEVKALPEYLYMFIGPNLAHTQFYYPDASISHSTTVPYVITAHLSDAQQTTAWYLFGNHFADLLGRRCWVVFSARTACWRCLLALIVQEGLRGEKLTQRFRKIIRLCEELLIRLTEKQGSVYLGDQTGLDVWEAGEIEPLKFFEGRIWVGDHLILTNPGLPV